jgi:hypothetical protein
MVIDPKSSIAKNKKWPIAKSGRLEKKVRWKFVWFDQLGGGQKLSAGHSMAHKNPSMPEMNLASFFRFRIIS